MYERLTAEDVETRRKAARDLYRMAGANPESAGEYALTLVDLTEDSEAGHYATATLRRIVSATVLDVDSYVETLRAAVVDGQQSTLDPQTWLGTRPSSSASDDELRRTADLLAWLAKECPTSLAGETGTLLAALERANTRAGAMEALFHLSSRRPSVDIRTELIVNYFHDEDPGVRGDAIGTVGQIERVGAQDDVIPYVSELLRMVDDPDVAVQQTSLGVLTRGSEYWTHYLSTAQLYGALTRIVTVINDESDQTVRSRATSFYDDLAKAAVNGAVQSVLGSDGTPSHPVSDSLINSAAKEPELAYEVATGVAYHAKSADSGEARRDEILNRIAEQYPRRFESGEDLLETAQNNGGTISVDQAKLVLDIVSAQSKKHNR